MSIAKVNAPCIICGSQLDQLDDTLNHPCRGVAFLSYGNYGSAVFDPMDISKFIEINICDNCLLDAVSDGVVVHSHNIPMD